MPRSIDVAARERQVIEAAWRVIIRDGMPALTVRNVAQEAGLAPSSLRYVFPSQASVREKSIRAVLQRLRERIDAIPRDSASWAADALLELLPLDAQRRAEVQVWLALGVAAVTDPALQPLRVEVEDAVRGICVEACKALGVGDAARIQELHALTDGLAVQIILRSNDNGRWARRVLRGHLDRLARPRSTPDRRTERAT